MKSSLVDRFWCLRCLIDCIDLYDMIWSFASGVNASLVAKIRTKKIIPLLSIKSSPVDRFQSLRCLNNRIDLPDMIGSFASVATASLVAKNGTKTIIPLLWIKSSKKPQIKKFYKTDLPKSGNFYSKFHFEIFKTQ